MTSRPGVALVLAGLLAMPAAADVVCRRKARVVVRAECKRREKLVELPSSLPKGPPGDQGADAPTPVRVVDAAGLQVGLFAEPGNEDNSTLVVFEVAGHLVYYLIGRPLIGVGNDSFYHQVADCSDPPVLVQDPTDFVQRGTVIDATAYYAADPIEVKIVVAREYVPFGGNCGSDAPLVNGHCCAPTLPQALPVGSAAVVFELSEFTPPFRLEP